MNTLYLDIFSGISGDMFIGALIDLGVDPIRLELELRKLGVEGYHLHFARQRKAQIEGVKFDVHEHDHHDDHEHGEEEDHDHGHDHEESAAAHTHTHDHAHGEDHHTHEHHHDEENDAHGHGHSHDHDHEHEHDDGHEHGATFAEISEVISESELSAWVKEKSIAVFRRIAVAEGKIHGHPADQVHFHEVGAIDSIVDIVGACIGLEMLGCPKVLAGPVVEGFGWIDCAHGRFPIPAPATLEILSARSIPIRQCDEPHELVTPTGAALLAEFAESFGPLTDFAPSKIGFGLGTRDNKTRPNVLRALLGANGPVSPASANDWETDTIAVLETNLDDLPAEILGHFVELALAAGALDVFHTPVQMKKSRPGTLLTVLCAAADADRLTELVLVETSALGVRRTTAERRKLRRESRAVKTEFGEAQVKVGLLNGKVVNYAPEFETCKALALRAKVPLKKVYDAVAAARPQT